MNPLFLIPVAVIIVGVALSFYMTKKHNAAKSLIDMDLERSKYELYKQEILASEFPQLKQWMKGKSIDAFTSASVPQTMASKVQGIVTDGIKNVALSAVGVKLRRIETECFWVLSGNDLYFFTTNEVGELDETIVFDNFRIEKAQLEFVGILKLHFGVYLKSSEEYLPKAHVITFGMEDGPMSLAIHDRLNYVVDPTDMFNQKKQMETRMKFQVVGERFVTTLQDKFPNLKIA